MDNVEAMQILVTKRNEINEVINCLNRYQQESDNWIDTFKKSQMAEVKRDSLIAGADLDTWDGTKRPIVPSE
jgi:hypothetical protein